MPGHLSAGLPDGATRFAECRAASHRRRSDAADYELGGHVAGLRDSAHASASGIHCQPSAAKLVARNSCLPDARVGGSGSASTALAFRVEKREC